MKKYRVCFEWLEDRGLVGQSCKVVWAVDAFGAMWHAAQEVAGVKNPLLIAGRVREAFGDPDTFNVSVERIGD